MSLNVPAGRHATDFVTGFVIDWQRFESAKQASADLSDYLAAANYTMEEKQLLLYQVFEGLLEPFTLSLLGLLLAQGKLAAAPQIGAMAAQLLDRWNNTLTVQVTTAAPLPAAEEEALTAMLQERYGKDILLKKTVDETQSGGALLRVVDKMFDGRVKSQADFTAAFAADWQIIEDALNSGKEDREFLGSAEHALAEKQQLLRRLLGEKIDPLMFVLLSLLVEKGAVDAVAAIGAVARNMLKRWQEMLTVQITTAAPLLPAEEQALISMLQERYGQEILLQKTVKAELIGGAVLKIGDTLFDGSIQSQLATLQKELLK
ncbi:MAG: ATP synthase F1 subunit delta [Clostridiales bacterium]|nr:ATP synthase F1 subunit delta [Clostridiales bacterium]